ncbi:MAG: hypothetical protein RL215_2616 [Planctomycetota bacterium]|jgi:hypothetical protein
MALDEHIWKTPLMVRGHHQGNCGAGRVVEVMMYELADMTAGAAAENDDPGGKSKQKTIGERDGVSEVLPSIRWGAGYQRRNEQLLGGDGVFRQRRVG